MSSEAFDIDMKLINECVRIYGKYSQVDMAIEEMSELTKALLKERRGDTDNEKKAADHIAEEIADVIIMLEQLMIIFDNTEEIQKQIYYKLERQGNRLKQLVDSEFSVKEPNPQPLPESHVDRAVDN